MSEPLKPIRELENLKFSVSALANMVGAPGSYEKENAENIKQGIRARIDWVIEQLESQSDQTK